jgi:hypothetical protein
MTTYLELVNNVLRRLREEEVATVQATSYSKLIGDIVNDAKKIVESSWDWSALRETLDITTVAGTFNYAFVNSGNDLKVLHAYNDTKDWDLQYQTPIWFDQKYMMSTPQQGSPEYYVFNGVDVNGNTQVDLYPEPNVSGEILRFNVILKPVDLSADTDKLKIPHQPVIHLALALAARERGETGGTSTPEYFAIADKYMSDAIAFDAQKHPEETIWYTS